MNLYAVAVISPRISADATHIRKFLTDRKEGRAVSKRPVEIESSIEQISFRVCILMHLVKEIISVISAVF